MKRLSFLLIALLISTFTALAQSQLTAKQIKRWNYKTVDGRPQNQRNKDTTIVMPMYPNGARGLLKDIHDNTKYPESSRESVKTGRVVVQFIIGKDGKVRDAVVIESTDDHFNNAVLQAFNTLKRFVPAYKNGEPIDIKFTYPVRFGLKEQYFDKTHF